MKTRSWGVCAALGVALPFVLVVPAHAASAVLPYDFDADGHPDLVVGAPHLRVGAVKDAGGVVVLPSSKKDVSRHEQVITQASRGVPGKAETLDAFGSAVASADFNGDGFADLAIGQAQETVGSAQYAGALTVVYGSRSGLDTGTAVGITLPGSARLGTSLAAADFTGDGIADLAVGSPDEDTVRSEDLDYPPSGVVHILRGGADGLTKTGRLAFRRQVDEHTGDVNFGQLLSAADLNGDGRTDLVVGSGGVENDEYGAAGSVSVCLGAQGGPTGCARVLQSDQIGGQRALATGNVTGSAVPEIVVGAHDTIDGPGHVTVVNLKSDGVTPSEPATVLTEKGLGLPDSENDGFGLGVSVGDVNRDGYADLVLGAGFKDDARGGVFVIRGAADGDYAAHAYRYYDQATKGVPGKREKQDTFGKAVALLDLDSDRHLDLVVGAPGENGDDGSVTVLPGSGSWFDTGAATAFTLQDLGVKHPNDATFGDPLGKPSGS